METYFSNRSAQLLKSEVGGKSVEINITRWKSVSGSAGRLAIADELDNLRFWAKQNPPDGCRVILAGIAKPKSKSASGIKGFRRRGRMKEPQSGTEDFVLSLKLAEM